jgi:hypothetical protein
MGRYGFPGQLYDPEIYGQAAAHLALYGVEIEARRYKKRIPLEDSPLRISRMLVYDVIDVVDENTRPDESIKATRGKELTRLYPRPSESRQP